jgi:hypothetical protein
MIEKIVFKNSTDYPLGTISSQIIGTLDFGFETFYNEIIVENCIIDTLILHNARFVSGFCMRNCIVKNKVQYEMGGHNQKRIVFSNNIFEGLFVFLDCIFEEELVLIGNQFLDGCTLYNGYNEFRGLKLENNIGKMDDDRWD